MVVVQDATAGPRLPDEDGYLAAIINYRYLAHALWTPERTLVELPDGHGPRVKQKSMSGTKAVTCLDTGCVLYSYVDADSAVYLTLTTSTCREEAGVQSASNRI